MSTTFSDLPLRVELLEAAVQLGFDEPTPIQLAALPPALAGSDVVGQAATGSGKTAAFGLTLLQRLRTEDLTVQALVLCPTRELAEQVGDELRRLAQRLENTRVVVLVGGRPMRAQTLALQHGAHIVVGTPGRVAKHLSVGTLSLDALEVLVLDEADRMLDMGFEAEVMEVVGLTPTARQTLLFSATFPDGTRSLAERVQRDAVEVRVSEQVDRAQLRQQVVRCDPRMRWQTVADLLALHQPASALVFCETRADVDHLTQLLHQGGAAVLALHGALDQRERDDVLVQLLNGSARVCVATDVASRGLDIEALSLVVVSELSPDPEVHVHRIGRTGRAEESGLAISVVAGEHEEARLLKVEEALGQALEAVEPPARARGLSELSAPNRTVLLLSGRRQKIRKGDIMGALVKDAGVPTEAIGRIDLSPTTCAVAVEQSYARRAHRWLQTGRIKKQKVRTVLLGE